MAKSQPFFIRAELNHTTASAWEEQSIDLGSYVNLGVSKSTLVRIHNIAFSLQNTSDPEKQPVANASGGDLNIGAALTTQSISDMPTLDDKSVAALWHYFCVKSGTDVQNRDSSTFADPRHYTDGYLIGVDTLYIGSIPDQTVSATYTASVMIECTLETATQASSTALALSQQ